MMEPSAFIDALNCSVPGLWYRRKLRSPVHDPAFYVLSELARDEKFPFQVPPQDGVFFVTVQVGYFS